MTPTYRAICGLFRRGLISFILDHGARWTKPAVGHQMAAPIIVTSDKID